MVDIAKGSKLNISIATSAPTPAVQAPAILTPAGGVAWEDAPTEVDRRVAVTEIYGDTGTGRTHLAFTAPGPIAYMGAAEKIEGLIQRASQRTKVRMVNFGGVFSGDPESVKAQALPVWNGVMAAFYDALGWARSIILDTHTEAWELIRMAHFGGQKPEGGRVDANYGPVNALWRSLFKAARIQDTTNFIVIGQTKDEWVDGDEGKQVGGITIKTEKGSKGGIGKRTGRTIRAGQKEIGMFCDVVVRTSKVPAQGGPEFQGLIEKGWYNAEYEGTVLTNDKAVLPGGAEMPFKGGTGLTLPEILALITETPTKDWLAER